MEQVKCNVIIPRGWKFVSADFSMSPRITLTRDFNGLCWWHTLTEMEQKEKPIYIIGIGVDLQTALDDAIKQIESENNES